MVKVKVMVMVKVRVMVMVMVKVMVTFMAKVRVMVMVMAKVMVMVMVKVRALLTIINKGEKMQNIDNLTFKEIKQIQSLFKSSEENHPYEIGKKYFIRTVTHHFTGVLEAVFDKELVLSEASWIADDGRFSDALNQGSVKEVEPYPKKVKVIIGRGSLIDMSEWLHSLPLEQK